MSALRGATCTCIRSDHECFLLEVSADAPLDPCEDRMCIARKTLAKDRIENTSVDHVL
ncbi:hypothetical protein F442_10486 [Phytophthora nicotianae P10297]|uniref:Uncharacterized protein n=1 Tax=Phytophthora nicotianae P10297 TaxID=1317064 RepID=W2Z5F7_PHYNI|nr:hypothetical protein F442_10486 [Phytophthora nicotianae P10297]